MDRVRMIKIEDPSTGGTQTDDEGYRPADPNQDYPSLRGVILQNDTTNDNSVVVSRDTSNNMIFTDPIAGPCTLTQLLAGGSGVSFSPNSLIIDTDGELVYIGDGDMVLRSY